MAAPRKTTPPPAGPTCPGCQSLAAELARLQRQQRKQATEIRKLQAALLSQETELFEERTRSIRLDKALSQYRFLNPYRLLEFSQHLPEGNALAAGLTHLN